MEDIFLQNICQGHSFSSLTENESSLNKTRFSFLSKSCLSLNSSRSYLERPPLLPKPTHLLSKSFVSEKASKIPLWKGSQETLRSTARSPKPKKWESCSNLELTGSSEAFKNKSNSESRLKNKQLNETYKKLKHSHSQDEIRRHSSSNRLRPYSIDFLKFDEIKQELKNDKNYMYMKDKAESLEKQNKNLLETIKALSERETELLSQLSDVKDQSELLEFRVLELESLKNQNPSHKIEYKDNLDVTSEPYQDFQNEKVQLTKRRLVDLVENLSSPADKSLLLQTIALLEALCRANKTYEDEKKDAHQEKERKDSFFESKDSDTETEKRIQGNQYICLTEENSKLKDTIKILKEEVKKKSFIYNEMLLMTNRIESDYKKKLFDLTNKLNSSYIGRDSESRLFDESSRRNKILERRNEELKAQVEILTTENTRLNANDTSLTQSYFLEHESKRLPSKNKSASYSSGISSDLSDSETEMNLKRELLIESGIFEESDLKYMDSSTQTLSLELSELYHEIQKLTKFQNSVEGRGSVDVESFENTKHEKQDFVSLQISENVKNNSRFGTDGKWNEKILQFERLETSYRAQIKELEDKIKCLIQENLMIEEERCELEEQENDSRLQSQRWEQQYIQSLETNRLLSEDLENERLSFDHLKGEFDEYSERVKEIQNDSAYYESLLQRYEQKIFDLEEVEVELRDKILSLKTFNEILSWWLSVTLSSGIKISGRPMIDCAKDFLSTNPFNCRQPTVLLPTIEAEYEEKEKAILRTLEEADTILRNVENNYRQTLNELEKDKLLVNFRLETLERNLGVKMEEIEEKISEEVFEALSKCTETEKENQCLSEELKDLQRRFNSLQSSEHLIKQRVLELENSESANMEQLRSAENALENKIRQLRNCESEIISLVTSHNSEMESLRNEVESLTRAHNSLKTTIRHTSNELKVNETSYKRELTQYADELSTLRGNQRNLELLNERLHEEIIVLREEIKYQGKEMEKNRENELVKDIQMRHRLNAKDFQINELILSFSEHSSYRAKEQSSCPIFQELDSNFQNNIDNCQDKFPYSHDSKNSLSIPYSSSSFTSPKSDFRNIEILNRCESDEILFDSSENENVCNSVIGELRSLLQGLEEKLKVVSRESQEFQERLYLCEQSLDLKQKELDEKTLAIRELKIENERISSVVEKTKSKTESLTNRFLESQADFEQLRHRSLSKDFLIRNLADMLAASPNYRSSSAVKQLRETTFKPSYHGNDFTLDSLCHYLEEYSKTKAKDSIKFVSLGTESSHEEYLRIVRRVGSESLLLSWSVPFPMNNISGFHILLNGKLIQRIRNLVRGQTLLHGLTFDSDLRLEVQCIGKNEAIISESFFLKIDSVTL